MRDWLLISLSKFRRMSASSLSATSGFSIGETRIGQGRDAAKRFLQENPETADKLEADIRRNFDKLMSNQSRIAAKAAGRAVDVSADDFEDAD